jgi:adenylosuccinate lyase
MFETYLTILGQMDAYEAVIAAETARYLPFLMTTTVMMEAVKRGVGRETAHKVIKEHAVATVADLRTGAVEKNNLLDRLAEDGRLGLSREELGEILRKGDQEVGAAKAQVAYFAGEVKKLEEKWPVAAGYVPGGIL